MKKLLSSMILITLCSFSQAWASNNQQLDAEIYRLQLAWEQIKYQMQDEEKQEKAMEKLASAANQVSARYPSYAEPKIWEAIILSTQAGYKGGLGALGLVKQAKSLLEKAESINPRALDGSIYTSLGSLYYKVPGWPIGFGDKKKAKIYLEQALTINPTGIDPNYFYGDFLMEQGEYRKALEVLQYAMQAPPRVHRPLADAGRKQEIMRDIQVIKQKLHIK